MTDSTEHHANPVEAALRALDVSHGRAESRDATASFSALSAKLDLGDRAATRVRHPSRAFARSGFGVRYRPLWWGIAAVGLAGAIVLYVTQRVSPTRTPASVQTYATAPGQQSTVTLPDGTRAQLGPATTLAITANSGSAGTTAQVDGQVLFTVTQHDRRPFTVHAANAVTQVLGTTFLVRHYDTDRVVQVVVSDGRVSVRRRTTTDGVSPGAILTAQSLGVIDDSGHIEITPNIAVDEYTGWTSGRLVFRKRSAQSVVAELSRASGRDIQLADSILARQVVTWNVTLGRQPLEVSLDELAALLDAHVIRTGARMVIVSGRSAGKAPGRFKPSFPRETQYGK